MVFNATFNNNALGYQKQVNRMLYSAKKTTPVPLNCQTLLLAKVALLSMASQCM
jgi:hypothetical protein